MPSSGFCDIFGALIERRSYRTPTPAVDAYAIPESMTGRLGADLVGAFRPVMTTFDPVAAVQP